MSSKKCCVPGCMASGKSHKILHGFPKPADRQRFNAWVMAIGGDILELDNEYIYKNRRVCHVHFEEKFCCRKERISNIAVPTLNLQGPLSLPMFTHTERKPLRQIDHSIETVPSTPNIKTTDDDPKVKVRKNDRCTRISRKYENKLEEQQRVVLSNKEEFEINMIKDDPDNISMQSDEIYYDPLSDLSPIGNDTISHSELKLGAVDCPIMDTVNEDSPADRNVFDIEPNLIKVLKDLKPVPEEWGPCAHEDVARRFQLIMSQGLDKEAKDELVKKYLFPKNLSFAKAPMLNLEIATMLTDSIRDTDMRILNKQAQLGRSLSALSLAITTLLGKNPDISEVVRILMETGELLADSHFMETDTRQAKIMPLVDDSLNELLQDRKRDSTLFGENLDDLLKNCRGIKQTGQDRQATKCSRRDSGVGVGQRRQYPNTRREQRQLPGGKQRRHRHRQQQHTDHFIPNDLNI